MCGTIKNVVGEESNQEICIFLELWMSHCDPITGQYTTVQNTGLFVVFLGKHP